MKRLKADLDLEDLRILKNLAFTAGEGYKVALKIENDMPQEVKDFGEKLLKLSDKLSNLISQIDEVESGAKIEDSKQIVIDNKATA